jgi:hypothetical protein
MSYRAKEWTGPGILALIAIGFQVSPIESMLIAIVIWSAATIWALFVLIRWPPIWTRLACVKIEVQDSSIMGIYPPLPDNQIYGRMEPIKVQFKLSSWLKIQIDSIQLWSGATECSSKSFSRKNGNIFEAWFEIPIKWFKGKTRKAYIRVSTRGRQWYSQEFEIKVNNQNIETG